MPLQPPPSLARNVRSPPSSPRPILQPGCAPVSDSLSHSLSLSLSHPRTYRLFSDIQARLSPSFLSLLCYLCPQSCVSLGPRLSLSLSRSRAQANRLSHQALYFSFSHSRTGTRTGYSRTLRACPVVGYKCVVVLFFFLIFIFL